MGSGDQRAQERSRKWLGTFSSAEEAARAYDRAAALMYGSRAQFNLQPPLHPPASARSSSTLRPLLPRPPSMAPRGGPSRFVYAGFPQFNSSIILPEVSVAVPVGVAPQYVVYPLLSDQNPQGPTPSLSRSEAPTWQTNQSAKDTTLAEEIPAAKRGKDDQEVSQQTALDLCVSQSGLLQQNGCNGGDYDGCEVYSNGMTRESLPESFIPLMHCPNPAAPKDVLEQVSVSNIAPDYGDFKHSVPPSPALMWVGASDYYYDNGMVSSSHSMGNMESDNGPLWDNDFIFDP